MRRLDQLLSSLGYCSRKETKLLCHEDRVTVGGEVWRDAGARVEPSAVQVDGEPLDHPDGLTVLFHKPTGLVCSHDARDGRRVYDALPPRWLLRTPRVTTVGRLDKDTSGLLVITDDGALVQRLTSPKHHVEKVYEATVDHDAGEALVQHFARGVELHEGDEVEVTKPAKLKILEPRRCEVTMTEGRYHQVRRMFAALGYQVQTLHRTRFGEWTLDGLAPGAWRDV